jgi:hypothetical protein
VVASVNKEDGKHIVTNGIGLRFKGGTHMAGHGNG